MKTETELFEQVLNEKVSPKEREEAIRRIVKNHQYEKIEGQTIDATTANMLVQIMDNLNKQHKEKFITLPILQMVDLGWKLVKGK